MRQHSWSALRFQKKKKTSDIPGLPLREEEEEEVFVRSFVCFVRILGKQEEFWKHEQYFPPGVQLLGSFSPFLTCMLQQQKSQSAQFVSIMYHNDHSQASFWFILLTTTTNRIKNDNNKNNSKNQQTTTTPPHPPLTLRGQLLITLLGSWLQRVGFLILA